jgi:hypothetical protein
MPALLEDAVRASEGNFACEEIADEVGDEIVDEIVAAVASIAYNGKLPATPANISNSAETNLAEVFMWLTAIETREVNISPFKKDWPAPVPFLPSSKSRMF